MKLAPGYILELEKLLGRCIRRNVPLRTLSSFRIGGPADAVVDVRNLTEVAQLLRFVRDNGVSHLVLGAGTNVLFHDDGYRGLIIRTNGLKEWEIHSNGSGRATVRAAAGVSLQALVSRASSLGWEGLEPLWGIPGSFGGAIVSNAGAGGACIGDFLTSVTLMNESGEQLVLKQGELRYRYRHMEIPRGTVVVEGALQLSPGDRDDIAARIASAKARRRSTQPWAAASAGCIFKNPSPGKPAGAIVDALGLKGVSIGDAVVSEVHANFIINRGNASASDVVRLIDLIRSRVKAEENIDLELEIRLFGAEDT